jgi:hypothetical protein
MSQRQFAQGGIRAFVNSCALYDVKVKLVRNIAESLIAIPAAEFLVRGTTALRKHVSTAEYDTKIYSIQLTIAQPKRTKFQRNGQIFAAY